METYFKRVKLVIRGVVKSFYIGAKIESFTDQESDIYASSFHIILHRIKCAKWCTTQIRL